jgi:nicotinate (nicotinamide) nucleotide adenylyltransferase
LEDILGEAIELSRATDLTNLKEEAGDVLASTLALCNEAGWDASKLLNATLAKIANRKQQYKSLGRKVKTAILGGAFDPITVGHIQIAKYVLDVSRTFDEVHIMPCYGHMSGKGMASAKHRLAMCEIAARNGRIKVFDYEIKNKLSSETYQTVKLLLEEDFAKNQYDYSWIIGMDNANTFDRWVNYQLLEQMIRFVVVPRTGYSMDPKATWYLRPPHIFLGCAEKPIMDVSSTQVRGFLKDFFAQSGRCDFIGKYLDQEVFRYIQKHKLYR